MGRAGNEQLTEIGSRPVRRKIAVDFDSTAWPFHTAYGEHPECPPIGGEPLTGRNWQTWDTPSDLLLDRFTGEDGLPDMPTLYHEMQRMMDESRSYEKITHYGLFPGFAKAMSTLQEAGFEPVIVTDNSEEGTEDVRRYLASQGLMLDVVLAKRGQPKIDWCLANGAVLLIDDAPKTITMAHAAGLQVATLRYLYNAAAIAESGAVSADSWLELLPKLLDELAAQKAA